MALTAAHRQDYAGLIENDIQAVFLKVLSDDSAWFDPAYPIMSDCSHNCFANCRSSVCTSEPRDHLRSATIRRSCARFGRRGALAHFIGCAVAQMGIKRSGQKSAAKQHFIHGANLCFWAISPKWRNSSQSQFVYRFRRCDASVRRKRGPPYGRATINPISSWSDRPACWRRSTASSHAALHRFLRSGDAWQGRALP